MAKNKWLTVGDLIEILEIFPQDAKIVVENDGAFEDGVYYATRDEVTFCVADDEKQVTIGTNYNTKALGSW